MVEKGQVVYLAHCRAIYMVCGQVVAVMANLKSKAEVKAVAAKILERGD